MNASWSRTALIAVNLPTKILLIATLAFTLLPMGAYGMESAEARKIKTEKYLKSKKVPFNKDLPLIEDAKSVKIRSAQDVARRAIVLYNITALGFGIEKQKVVETLKKSGVWDSMAPSEKEFVEAAKPTKQQTINATWRVEALWTLLWALGKVESLDFPIAPCDPQRIHGLMPNPEEAKGFIASAKLRNIEAILDETDKIYRIHWAVRDAQLNKKTVPAKLDSGVVVERHYALNWLIWYADEWDEITTDT
ncbi:MAG TPA: DUF4272 domain-containing protein [Nitrospiraceae bacterium]|nr:DUF4272 domain-containing protein [Nitrospiraceae bacterium]